MKLPQFFAPFILLTTLVITGCSGSKTSNTNLEVSIGSLATDFPGGLLVKLFELDTKKELVLKLSGTNANIPYGRWTFTIAGFSGPGQWQGTTTCGKIEDILLNLPIVTVDIYANTANCSQPEYVTLISTVVTTGGTWDVAQWDQGTWGP